jgi:hypothetical protein
MSQRLTPGDSAAYEYLAGRLTRMMEGELCNAYTLLEAERAEMVITALRNNGVRFWLHVLGHTREAACWLVESVGPHAYAALAEGAGPDVYGWLTEGTESALHQWVARIETIEGAALAATSR